MSILPAAVAATQTLRCDLSGCRDVASPGSTPAPAGMPAVGVDLSVRGNADAMPLTAEVSVYPESGASSCTS